MANVDTCLPHDQKNLYLCWVRRDEGGMNTTYKTMAQDSIVAATRLRVCAVSWWLAVAGRKMLEKRAVR